MADAVIRQAEAEKVAEENSDLKAEAADIREEVAEGKITPDAAEARLRQIEARLDSNERNLVELRTGVEERITKHDHPAHPELRALSEHLDGILKAERKPKKKSRFWG